MTDPHVVVIGGGITGLSAAATLVDHGRKAGLPLRVSLLEAGAHLGGHAQTITEDGFVVEAGPNGFLNRESQTLALVESLGLGGRLIEARPEARRRYLVRGGRLCAVPDGPLTLATTPALSWRGKLRLAGEPFAPGPPAGIDETVHAFATRRIGAEAADMLVDAAVSGISAGDSRRLSLRAQFPMMSDMEREHGSLVRAMFARRRRGTGPSRLLGFEGGMGTLTAALAGRLGEAATTHAVARAIEPTPRGWRVRVEARPALDADHLVLAIPARAAAPLVRGFDDALAEALGGVGYAGIAVVALGYRTADVPRALDGYGYLVTRGETMATLGVVWESSLFTGRAPEGHALLRVMLGGSRRPEVVGMPEAERVALARRELGTVMGIGAEPVRTWAFSWPEAIAQYTVGHLERRARTLELAGRHRGLRLCGTSYDGVSFNHAVKSGRVTALDLIERLRSGARHEPGVHAHAVGA
ncbi:MAG: protoporphyrinogen oxidase [Vicinamibacterales bacterium]